RSWASRAPREADAPCPGRRPRDPPPRAHSRSPRAPRSGTRCAAESRCLLFHTWGLTITEKFYGSGLASWTTGTAPAARVRVGSQCFKWGTRVSAEPSMWLSPLPVLAETLYASRVEGPEVGHVTGAERARRGT